MYTISQTTEDINSNGGLSLVQRLLDSNKAMKQWDSELPADARAKYPTSCIIRSMVGLMTAGDCGYAAIENYAGDSLFQALAGGSLPSQEALRQRLDGIAEKNWQPVLDSCVSAVIRSARPVRICVDGVLLLPVDIDVSVLEDDSHKEGIGMSCHQTKGYAPIFAYAGREGYMVASELRCGSQHCENGAAAFLRRTVRILKKAGFSAEELLVRVDSGHDASDFIKELDKLGVRYIVKRNPRNESPEQLVDSIKGYEKAEAPRPGKKIYRGVRSDRRPSEYPDYKGFMVVEGTVRTILADGEALLIPQVEADSWWTNLTASPRRISALYHDHGTSEQFHSGLKSDMGIELLPSGTFITSSLVLGLAALAFDCLRWIGQKFLREKHLQEVLRRREEISNDDGKPADSCREDRRLRFRLRTVLLHIIKLACKVVSHAGRMLLKFGKDFCGYDIFNKIYNNLCEY